MAERGCWQPIELAPKDVFVLLWWPYWSVEPVIGKWRTAEGRWTSDVAIDEGDESMPIAWMPLPDPPQ